MIDAQDRVDFWNNETFLIALRRQSAGSGPIAILGDSLAASLSYPLGGRDSYNMGLSGGCHDHAVPDSRAAMGRSPVARTISMLRPSPPMRRLFYCLVIGSIVAFGCRAVNAEPVEKSTEKYNSNYSEAGSSGPGKRYRYTDIGTISDRYEHISGNAAQLIAVAERYLGSRNPTGRRGPWCGAFVNLVLRRAGLAPMPGNRAVDALRLGPRLPRAVAGSLIVRRHHVEIALGDGRSISGNWGGRVAIHASSHGVVILPRS